MFNPNQIKKDFPVFRHYPNLIFTDNASTSQKPDDVIHAISACYENSYANIHRAVYDLGVKADEHYNSTKNDILRFYDANEDYDLIYTGGTTDGLNKLARNYESKIGAGHNIIVSEMEHHSNFLPWQELCKKTKAQLIVIPITPSGELDMEALEDAIDQNTKVVSLIHISNTLGTINDLAPISQIIRRKSDADFILDAAQSAAFYGAEIKNADADAVVFSAHKMFGPSGIGFILSKKEYTKALDIFNYGGGMVIDVGQQSSFYKTDISRLEAGTPPIAQIAGTRAMIAYLNELNLVECRNHIHSLGKRLRDLLTNEGIQILGRPESFSGIVSIYFEDIHPHDVASFLNNSNIAVRAGHHCTQLIMKKFDVPASTRISLSIYNTNHDIDLIVESLNEMKAYFK